VGKLFFVEEPNEKLRMCYWAWKRSYSYYANVEINVCKVSSKSTKRDHSELYDSLTVLSNLVYR
jgi:hypothetical protein